jgi:hypothetical protein
MIKLTEPQKSIIVIISVLLIVLFYESKRIETLAIGVENRPLRYLALSYASFSDKIKSALGLERFFQNQADFWVKIKKSPVIFSYRRNSNPEIPPPTPQPPQSSIPKPPYNILIVGDSFIAEGFGPVLEKELLLYKNVTAYREGKYSTGLSRPDYFNWDVEIKNLINTHNPNVAIVMFGANDGQDQRTLDGKVIHYGTDDWNVEYAKRVGSFLNILLENKIFVFWIGNPIARDKKYSDKMVNLNSIYEDECKKQKNVVFIPTWSFLTDSEGKYSAYLLDENGKLKLARASDGIHTTTFGSKILVDKVMLIINNDLQIELIQSP